MDYLWGIRAAPMTPMTMHQLLTWAVPFFAVMTVVGAALSIARLFSDRSTKQQGQLSPDSCGSSSSVEFAARDRRYQIKYRLHQLTILAAALGAALASAMLALSH
jgi:hypothetical protein